MSFKCSEPEGSSSGRWLYIRVWYRMFYVLKLRYKAFIRDLSIEHWNFLNTSIWTWNMVV